MELMLFCGTCVTSTPIEKTSGCVRGALHRTSTYSERWVMFPKQVMQSINERCRCTWRYTLLCFPMMTDCIWSVAFVWNHRIARETHGVMVKCDLYTASCLVVKKKRWGNREGGRETAMVTQKPNFFLGLGNVADGVLNHPYNRTDGV